MDNGAISYRRYLEGDESGFDEVLALYQDRLIFFIHRFVRNITVAEDLAEDAFVELLVHKRRYNGRVQLKTYLFTIGRNKALNYLKRASTRKDTALPDMEQWATDTLLLEERLLQEERKREVNVALTQINEDYRAVLHLVYMEDMTYEEAGKVLGKNRKQIENLAYRARQSLKAVLDKGGFHL